MALQTYDISCVSCLADWLAWGQNRLRGPAEDLVLSQVGRSLLKIRALDMAARGLQVGAVRRQLVHRRFLPNLHGPGVSEIEDARIIQTLAKQ
jgi:hypothetical protein